MIRIARWKVILTTLVCCGGILFSLPNIVSETQVKSFPEWLQKTVNLGLELRGGSHLQLEIDLKTVQKDLLTSMLDEVRAALRKQQIGYTALKVATQSDASQSPGIIFTLREPGKAGDVQKALAKIDPDWRVQIKTDGQGEIVMTQEAVAKRNKLIIEQSIEVVRRRVDESGTKEPIIQAQGIDRIILQLPGISDPADVKRLLGKTAKLTFRAVDENVSNVAIDASGKPIGQIPPGTEILAEVERRGDKEMSRYVAVKKQVMVSGDALVDAQVTMNQNGQPAVSLKFNSTGGRKFAEMSKDYLKKQFAIVLDNQVISAPVFQEIIPDGNGQISGHFTIKEAHELALLLRAGALPAPLKIIEERTVGPSLGADSIKDGQRATILAFILIAVFMILNYSLFGAFADLALVFNMVLLFAALSLLQATLTLPGIAAIALTMGMAVDANVLIYERIKEEIRNGLRPIAAIEAGYNRAMTTIIDSNLTTLIGAAVLFEFGTGSIRGFAVNLALGILISMFTAIALTKLVVAKWYGHKNRSSLPI